LQTILSDKGPISFSFDDCEVEWPGTAEAQRTSAEKSGNDSAEESKSPKSDSFDSKSKKKSAKSPKSGQAGQSDNKSSKSEAKSPKSAQSESKHEHKSSKAKYTLMGFLSAGDAWPWYSH